ncbi:MAG: ATP-binding protein [Oscillospiraceae bacterium]|nr:ATP-binding protein [Oscillospiraceae bacterium]
MRIGKVFENRLSDETITAISRIERIFNAVGMKPYYFPEYTLHGKFHVESVLSHAVNLITKETLEILDDKSIDALVLGICLHDIGMFISEDGFHSLLKDSMWSNLYDKFICDLKNADGKELDKIFGAILESDPKRDNVAERRLNMYDKSNIYSVGEFLRKHHHELAYYIAVNGFPKNGEPLFILEKDGYEQLIGYVAKAHRGNIRSIVDEIEKQGLTNKFQNYSPRNIPIVFLMSVIWIADEIDDKNEYRAPKLHEELKGIENEFSRKQWVDNRCVFEPQFNYDMSCIYVEAKPESSTQYLRIDGYCKKVQHALDDSWAVITEYHGKKYDLSIHRVKSNIYFIENYDFLPEDASLRINPEIAKLLVKPLYNDNPSYGIRELLANAIDACREREILDSEYTGTAQIICTLNAFDETFTIADNGVGMTGDVIIKYFMTVGASFRESNSWKQDFMGKDGRGRVERFGRFGIGILSAFLLGREIEVTTRHWQDTSGKGYRFIARLDGDCPDVEHVSCDFGTKIKIKVTDLVYEDKTTRTTFLFSEYIKYEFGIPHYPFDYPKCLYRISDSNDSLMPHQVYYYISEKMLEIKRFDIFEMKIGSLLSTGHYPINGQYFDTKAPIDFSLQSEASNEICKYNFMGFPSTTGHSSKFGFDNSWLTNSKSFTCAKIEKMFYNGMSVRLDDSIHDDNRHIDDENCNPLYISIDDSNAAVSLDLQKSRILDCEALNSIKRFHGFLLIMYPLTLEAIDSATLYDLLNKYPYDEIIKRDVASAPEKRKIGDIEIAHTMHEIPILRSSDFIFAYDIKYYSPDHDKKNTLIPYVYEAIIEWFEVAPGYEQNYEIPHNIEERKCKYQKAFIEYEKYITKSDI